MTRGDIMGCVDIVAFVDVTVPVPTGELSLASITIWNLEDPLKVKLRVQAARHG